MKKFRFMIELLEKIKIVAGNTYIVLNVYVPNVSHEKVTFLSDLT